MIRISDLRNYLRLKRHIGAFIQDPESGFEPSRRELSEGLARGMVIDGEEWTYSCEGETYCFSNPRKRFSIRVRPDGVGNDVLTSKEIARYLACYTTHENINEMVVDNWLARACRDGNLEEVRKPVFGYRLREEVSA